MENYIIPMLICAVLICGLKDKVKVFDTFSDGVMEGLNIILKLFPIMLGLFMSVSILRVSGIIDFISEMVEPIYNFLEIPKELTSLIMLKPISGSASLAIGQELMITYGVDSVVSLTAATIMGSTETTLYALAIYSSEIKKKISPKLVILAILGNFLAVLISSVICRLYFN